jgi:uncharacterized protein (TIGR00162 family)
MHETTIVTKKEISLKKPVLIEGLPGIGLVGKLAAEHMIKELKAEHVANLYSPHFPHQVFMRKNGVLRMLKNKFYAYHAKKGSDLLILVGDVQAITPEAQYEVCGRILDFAQKLGTETVYTIGGYGVGRIIDKPRVLGSATDKRSVEQLSKQGVLFGQTNGSIVGAAGLLLGLGRLRGMRGACLMGETHGSYVDAKSAQSVLEVLSKILGCSIDVGKLTERAKETERFMKKMEKEQEKQRKMGEAMQGGMETQSYIR